MAMSNLLSRFGLGLLLFSISSVPAVLAQGPTTVTVPKCQDCTTKASKKLQSCTAGGSNAQGCQASFKKHINHCNKKWCTAKTKKVKVNTPAP
jgi:hypothetical protein